MPANVQAPRTSTGDKPKSGASAGPGKTRIPPKKTAVKVYNSKKANRYFVLFFFAFTAILYWNSVLNKWSVDDNLVTGPQNELVKKGFGAIPRIFTSYYVDTKGNVGSQQTDYRPIVKMTFAFEYGLWGERPHISHFINLLLYFWVITLLFFILKRLLKNYNILFPFLITLLFMAHPIHTEVVASLKNRDELLAFLCGLGGLHYLLRYAERKKIIYLFAVLVLFFIGYLCKSSIAPFLALYLLVLYFFTDMKPKNFIWIFAVMFFVGMIAYFLPRFFLPKAVHVYSIIENPLFADKNLLARTGAAMMSLWFYLRILVFPYPLLYYYGYNMFPVSLWGNILGIFAILVHLGLFVYAIRKFREKDILSFAILYYFVAIAMYTNFITPVVGIVGERFAFNASLGFIIILVYALFRIFRTDPKSLTIEFNERAQIIVIIFLIMIPYTIMTIKRNREWRNLRDLYEADIKYQSKSVKANIEYAHYLTGMIYSDPNYQEHGNVNEKLVRLINSHFRMAIKIYPNDYSTLNDLAAMYIKFTPKPDSGIVFLRKAIALQPGLQPAWVNMAMVYRKTNKLDSAILCYQKVLQINPGELNAVFKMADCYYEKRDIRMAMKLNQDVMKKYPNLDVPYFNIGYYYIMHGDTTTAINYWEQAANRNPTYEVCTNLSMMYRARGNMQKSNYYYGLALDAEQRKKTQTPLQ
ncbi:MAG: tetratricopeptide repeat protein [Bacteroidetes bacterium]|nr:tetratricopeptide repeat protein [Bacteroidota bacterium]